MKSGFRKLQYNGRFDDSRFADESTVKHHDARNAVEAMLAGKPVPVAKTRPFGCSTKWKGRSAHVAQEEKAWQSAKVEVEEMSVELAAKLRKNDTNKMRMFNIWATWCAPCVKEMPDITAIGRKFSRRDFELITISLDTPKDKKKVEAFLGKHRAVMSSKQAKSVKAEGRKTNNYIYTGASTDALAKALDPEWKGPVPYTFIIDKDGKVIYRKIGIIDPMLVKKEILNVLTPYFQPKAKKK